MEKSLVKGWFGSWVSPCLSCSSRGLSCHSENKVVLFPCEEHLVDKFPCRKFRYQSVELYYFYASECPYFTSDGMCSVYGTEILPIDCKIYPLILSGFNSFVVDLRCEKWRDFVEDVSFLLHCMELIRSCRGISRKWVKAYLKV